MYSPKDVSGFLLLTLPNCTVDSPSLPPQTGVLSLQCVTLDPGQLQHTGTATTSNNDATGPFGNDRDVWLVLKLNSFEMVVSPTQRINYSRSDFTYIFLPELGNSEFIRLVVPLDPRNPSSAQDLETMEVILSQYGVLHDVDADNVQKATVSGLGADQPPPYTQPQQPPTSTLASTSIEAGLTTSSPMRADSASISDFKGHLVLMDQDSGEVMGTLDENVKLREDEALSMPKQGGEKDPVVVELPSEEEEARGRHLAYVHPAEGQDRDILMQTAGLISNGLLFLSSALSSGFASLANLYIAHSTPSTEPIKFSPRTSANVKKIHNISGEAVHVTSRTTNAIFKLVELTINRFTGTNTPTGGPLPQRVASPPPLPPRKEKPDLDYLQPQPPPLPPRSPQSPRARSPVGGSGAPPAVPPSKPRLLNRVLASTDIILTALEQSATQLIESGTDAVSRGLSHKYGTSAGDLSRLAGGTVRNVGLVYVDLRGVGRRALLKRAGKAVVKAKFAGRDIIFMNGSGKEAQGSNNPAPSVNANKKGK